jgi:glycosyltransferase involved in cell wall biosynthesis
VLLFLSHFEGLPNAVLEAMGAGVPVITTRVGSLPDVIDDGRTGFLVDVEDVPAAAAALARLLGDPELAARVGSAGREQVLEHFDIRNVWRAHARAVARAAAASRRPAAAVLASSLLEALDRPGGMVAPTSPHR